MVAMASHTRQRVSCETVGDEVLYSGALSLLTFVFMLEPRARVHGRLALKSPPRPAAQLLSSGVPRRTRLRNAISRFARPRWHRLRLRSYRGPPCPEGISCEVVDRRVGNHTIRALGTVAHNNVVI